MTVEQRIEDFKKQILESLDKTSKSEGVPQTELRDGYLAGMYVFHISRLNGVLSMDKRIEHFIRLSAITKVYAEFCEEEKLKEPEKPETKEKSETKEVDGSIN